MNFRLKYNGIIEFVFKTIVFVIILFGTAIALDLLLTRTAFYKMYLVIPPRFYFYTGIQKEIFVDSILFAFVAFSLANYRKLVKIPIFPFRWRQSVLLGFGAVVTLALHYYIKYIISSMAAETSNPLLWSGIKVLVQVIFVLLLFLAVFGLKTAWHLVQNYWRSMIFFAAVGFVFFVVITIFQNIWYLLANLITSLLRNIFQLIGTSTTVVPLDEKAAILSGRGGPVLKVMGFSAVIGKSCSGIDSLLLFISLYSLIFILDYPRVRKGVATLCFLIGIVGMFFVNVLRIFLLFLLGAYWSPATALGLFHTNVGWILFIIYFFVFWWIASKFVYRKQKKDAIK